MVLMDQYTRRIIGFGVHCGNLNGVAICTMFNKIIANKSPPQLLSSDHDPFFGFHRWQANLRILDIEEIKSVPYTPMSHPFVERLIRICRNEYLDRSLFWNSLDLQRKLDQFRDYFNEHRAHMGLQGKISNKVAENERSNVINLKNYRWQPHSRGLFQLPIDA